MHGETVRPNLRDNKSFCHAGSVPYGKPNPCAVVLPGEGEPNLRDNKSFCHAGNVPYGKPNPCAVALPAWRGRDEPA